MSAKPRSAAILLSGNGDGIVATAAAGLIDGDELIRYSASLTGEAAAPDALDQAIDPATPVVITDTNRRDGQRWGVVHEVDGRLETVDEEPLVVDPSDNRLPVFGEVDDPDAQTVAVQRGGLTVRASSYGNPVSYTPEDRPALALDDDLTTAWSVAAFSSTDDEHIEVRYDEPRTTDRIRLLQSDTGVQNRWITGVRLRFDGGDPVDVDLSEASRGGEGEWVSFPRRTFSTLDVEITGTDAGRRDSYDGFSPVGFADIRLGDGDLRLQESVRVPVDALDALGEDSEGHPLAFVLTRRRSRPTAPLRSDEDQTLVRALSLPTARAFGVSGAVRIDPDLSDAGIDELVGRPGLDEGGVVSSSSRRLPGDLTAGATAAIDGDPATHWSPGFLNQDGEWTAYQQADPLTFDHMDLQVVADGRHSVPTRLRIIADGRPGVEVDVPPVADQPERGATTTVPLDLPEAVTGRDVRIEIAASRPVLTTDWVSLEPVTMPVGITDWGIEGLDAGPAPARTDSGCRTDLLSVDGRPVPVRATGPTADALAGDPLDLVTCGRDGVDLPAGPSQVRSGDGRETGLQVDTLTLRSEAGGAATADTGPLLPDARRVPSQVVDQGRWRSTVEVGPRDEDTWLVIGQSDNPGWTASIDGRDLGPPVLADGYSSAFLIPAGADPVTVEVVWAPQRVVFAGLGISVLFALLCLVLALRPWRWVRPPSAPDGAAEPVDERPLALRLGLTSAGRAPSWIATVALAAVALLGGTAAVNPVAGLALALAVVVGVRVARARPLLVLGPAVLLAVSAAYTCVQQVRHRLPPGFQWPQRFEAVHGVAYTAVLLLLVGVLVDRIRTGRWGPDADAPDPPHPFD